MITLLLEIVKPNAFTTGYYNPAPDCFKAYPRSENGVRKAIKRFEKVINETSDVENFRIAAYEGKKEYYNEKNFIGYIDSDTIRNEFWK